jgi:hypothetical protein
VSDAGNLRWILAARANLRPRSTHYGDSRVDRESPKKLPLNAELTAEVAVWRDAAAELE